MEESYSSPAGPPKDCHSNPGGVTDKDCREAEGAKDRLIANSFMNYLLIGF